MPQKISEHRKKMLRSRAGKGRRPLEPLHPDLIAAAWSGKLKAEIERGFKLVKKLLFPVLRDDIDRLDAVRMDIDADAGLTNEIINEILKRYFGGMAGRDKPNLTKYSALVAKKLVNPLQKQVNRHHKTQFSKTFKRISGVDPLQFEPELSGFLEVAGDQNVNKIVTLNSGYFDSIRERTNQALRKGTSVSELTDEIIALTKTTQSRAGLIAVDQVQKLNADLESQRQQNNGITRYYWRTRRNARVRSKANSGGASDHAGLKSAALDWKFPPVTVLKGKRAGERNHPGQDINCKCWAEPVIEDLTGKRSRTLEAAELKTQKIINEGRVPGYKIPKAA